MGINLYQHQIDAIRKMKNGCILNGDVGTGKSRTAIAYYYILNDGEINPIEYIPMGDPPMDLYIITTAKKRDDKEWEKDMAPFLIFTDDKSKLYQHNVIIDSWNNIGKYKNVEHAFFIFDEQRLVGYGAWVKAFLKIAKANHWILLSATPGDTWTDYIPVFIANGFFKNKTDFMNNHVIFSAYSKYPKVDKYVGLKRLERLRDSILVDMSVERETTRHEIDVFADYDILKYKQITRERWDPYNNCPIESASEMCYTWRKVVNSDTSRIREVQKIVENNKRCIIFYNFDYELELLKNASYISQNNVVPTIAEWNGHAHQPIPSDDCWIYLVQYTAGCEGWNCILTDTIIFFSLNYSYKTMEQARGRIDRLNTSYRDLYYYTIRSRAPIDIAIAKALRGKKKFNERRFLLKK